MNIYRVIAKKTSNFRGDLTFWAYNNLEYCGSDKEHALVLYHSLNWDDYQHEERQAKVTTFEVINTQQLERPMTNNEPAFPVPEQPVMGISFHPGLTIRDLFAGLFAAATVACNEVCGVVSFGDELAREAYALADEMLEARDAQRAPSSDTEVENETQI